MGRQTRGDDHRAHLALPNDWRLDLIIILEVFSSLNDSMTLRLLDSSGTGGRQPSLLPSAVLRLVLADGTVPLSRRFRDPVRKPSPANNISPLRSVP